MKAPDQVRCRDCRAVCGPSSLYCPHCGASLREQGYREGGGLQHRRIAARWAGRSLLLLVLLGVIGGIYYVVSEFVLDRVRSTEITDTSAPTTTLVTTTKLRLLQGADAYGTALEVSKHGFPRGAAGVVLVAGDRWADAVFAAPLAKAHDGPVLLVSPEGLGADLAAELRRLGPSQVFLIGLPNATDVAAEVRRVLSEATVIGLAGRDRYHTAALVAWEVEKKLGAVDKVVIAPGDSFAEALCVAPLAAAQGWPILLTPQRSGLPQVTTKALAELGVSSVLVVGTQTSVSMADVERLEGADRYETSALVAQYAAGHEASFAHTALATGEDFPSALAAGPYLAQDRGIVLLTKGEEIPPAVSALLTANYGSIRTLDFIALPGLAAKMGG